MWHRIPLAIWAVLLFIEVTAHAQQPIDGSLLTQSSWCQFEIVRGRIAAMNPRQAKTQVITSENPKHGERQQLSIQVEDGLPCLRYSWMRPQQRFSIEVVRGDDITIRHEDDEGDVMLFRQPAQGPLTLVVDRATFRGPTIWHLLLDHPEICERHLLPALSLMRPHWQLVHRAEQVREALFEWAQCGHLPQRAELSKLVAQLGDASFARRQAAARELRAIGQPVLSYLEELDASRLDAEQRVRIAQLRETLAPHTADTPQRVGAWLVHSKVVWLILMEDAEPTRRHLASAQLAKLLDAPVAFNPEASQSDRQEAIARLRSQMRL